jgi:hypothetical protein
MKIIPEKITTKNLPHQQHVEFIEDAVDNALDAIELISDKMIAAVLKALKIEKLAKSDDIPTKLPRGYTGEVPRIEIDLNKVLPVIDDYLECIRWIFLGKGAGKKTEDLVEALGLMNKIPAGLVYGSFLNAVDTQRDYYSYLTGKLAPAVPNDFLEFALKLTQSKTSRYVDQGISQFKNRIVDTIQEQIAQQNLKNLQDVHSTMHSALSDLKEKVSTSKEKTEMLEGIIEDVASKRISISKAKRALTELADDFSDKTATLLSNELSAAASSGTHVALQEVFGAADAEIRIALVSIKDSRCCDECERITRNPDGTLKIYKLSEVASAGTNYGKKRNQWVPALKMHPRCRCEPIYIPPGFTVNEDDQIVQRD